MLVAVDTTDILFEKGFFSHVKNCINKIEGTIHIIMSITFNFHNIVCNYTFFRFSLNILTSCRMDLFILNKSSKGSTFS